MEKEDFAALNLADFCRDLLVEPHQVFPFDGVGVDELRQGQPEVSKRAVYDPYARANYMTGWIMKEARKATRTCFKYKRLDLSNFLALPTDVLFGIFESLHPVDLYHLIQSSKTFRSIILNPRYRGVWKNAFRKHKDLPSCPKGMPEPQWSSLLFGPDTCDICGNHGALPDFTFRKRLCEACWRPHLVYRGDLAHIMSGFPHNNLVVVWELVPRTSRRGSTTYSLSSNRPYLKKDVEAMVDRVKEFLGDIAAEVTAKLDENKANASAANKWAKTIYRDLSSERKRFGSEMAKRCMTRLANIGHDPRDTSAGRDFARDTLSRHGVTRLTPKVYRKIKPDLERTVDVLRRHRVALERKELVKLCYTEYTKTLKPEQWTSIVPLPEVLKLFDDFISSKDDVIGEITKKDALARFPPLTLQFMDSQVNRLASLLPKGTDHSVASMDCYARLNLATSVFVCKICQYCHISGKALCGWTNIRSHINQKSRSSTFSRQPFPHLKLEFSSVGYATSASLIRSLGLDPGTTTTEQLDLIDARFFCETCPILSVRGVRGREAYTWTECITHARQHAVCSWQLLTPEATRFVKEQEPLHPSPVSPAWGCNHCSKHFEHSVSLPSAKVHVNASHGIEKPVIGKDVIAYKHRFNFPGGYSSRKPFHYSLEPPCQFMCKMCPRRPIYRLWSMDKLIPHLRKKHHVAEPLQHDHWEKVEIVAQN